VPFGYCARMEELAFWAVFGGGVLAWFVAAVIKIKAGPRGRPCHSCGYDLTGLGIDDRCPECGNMYALQQHASWTARVALPVLSVTIGTACIGAAVALMPLGPTFPTMISAGIALSAACLTTVAFSSRTKLAGAALLFLGALAPCAAIILWMCYSAFVANPDPQSGLVILFLPPIGATFAGYGVLIAALLCTKLQLW